MPLYKKKFKDTFFSALSREGEYLPVQVLAVEVFVGENGPSEARVYHDPKIWIHSGDPHFLRDVKQLLKAGGFPCRVEYDRHKVVKRGYTNFVLAPPA